MLESRLAEGFVVVGKTRFDSSFLSKKALLGASITLPFAGAAIEASVSHSFLVVQIWCSTPLQGSIGFPITVWALVVESPTSFPLKFITSDWGS